MGFSYDVHEGVVKDEVDPMDAWLIQYGFVPDNFVPVLGQYQAIRNPNYREIVGNTAWVRTGLAGLNFMVRQLTYGAQGYITGGARRAMLLVPGMAYPISHVGKMLRAATWVSVGILVIDIFEPLSKIALKEFLSALNPMNYSPFLA
jgi:hypothetical protein